MKKQTKTENKKLLESMRVCHPILKSWSSDEFSNEEIKDTVFIALDLLEYLFELQDKKEENEEI